MPVVLDGVGVMPGQYVFVDSSGAVVIPDRQIEEGWRRLAKSRLQTPLIVTKSPASNFVNDDSRYDLPDGIPGHGPPVPGGAAVRALAMSERTRGRSPTNPGDGSTYRRRRAPDAVRSDGESPPLDVD